VFNIGPMELLVLGLVGLIILGPDKLPGLARDAARMLRGLREMATGARRQLRDELGPEFADIDLRNLHPRTAISRALLGEETLDGAANLRKVHPRTAIENVLRDLDSEPEKPQARAAAPEPPLARNEAAPFDDDAT
jgi:sec-independent protein translocase protein TatB